MLDQRQRKYETNQIFRNPPGINVLRRPAAVGNQQAAYPSPHFILLRNTSKKRTRWGWMTFTE